MRLRWEWLWVPAVCLVVFWVLSTVNPACGWTDVMDTLGIKRQDAYRRLGCMAIVLVGFCLIARILRKRPPA